MRWRARARGSFDELPRRAGRAFGRQRRAARGDSGSPPEPTHRRWRVAGHLALAVVAGGVLALLALELTPPVRGEIGPGTIELRARWRLDGQTMLRVPPLGAVSADTHTAPLQLEAAVQELDLVRLQQLAAEDEFDDALYARAESDIPTLIRRFATRSLLGAAVAGAVAGALVSRSRVRSVLAGTVGGLALVGLTMVFAWRGFDAEAFAEPSYHGALEQAPEVVEVARRHIDRIGDIQARVDLLARQITDLYAVSSIDTGFGDSDEVRILHVSDIHSNPLGVEVVRRLAESFDVDAVLDTGDLTSFGYPIEPSVVEGIATIPARYLFVPGNHDSDANRAVIGDLPGVRLLDGHVATVRGVRILGVGDPTFTADNAIDSDDAAAIRFSRAGDVASLVRRTDADVLAVHDARLASESMGDVPLVVSGHLHQRRLLREDGTAVLMVGSTGATGLGAFVLEEGRPYEAQLLRFVGRCLHAVDAVRLDGISGSFDLERRVFEDDPIGDGCGTEATDSAPEPDRLDSPASPAEAQPSPSPSSPSRAGSNSRAAELMQ